MKKFVNQKSIRIINFDNFLKLLERTIKTVNYEVQITDAGVRLFAIIRGRRHEFCPVTAVCYVVTGRYKTLIQYKEAAQEIGLPVWLAIDIARANDLYMIDRALSDKTLRNLQKKLAHSLRTDITFSDLFRENRESSII